jgi:hypothetical protein
MSNLDIRNDLHKRVKHNEAADFLCITPKTLYKWCSLGKITFSKSGKLNVYKLVDLEEFLERNVRLDQESIQAKAYTRYAELQKGAA